VSNPLPDQGLWDTFVEAKRQLHRRQAEFYQQASDRQAVLRAALDPRAGAWQQGTAFDFLTAFPSDVIPLLPEVFRWATKSERWAGPAREVIARIPRGKRTTLLELLFLEQLEAAEDDDYPNLAELAPRCEAWRLLERLVQQAANNDDPKVRELAEYYNATDGPKWQPKQ